MGKLIKTVALMGCGILLLVSPAAADFLFDYVGYDYTWPNAVGGLQDPFNYYEVVGLVNTVDAAILEADFENYEYTCHLSMGPGAVGIDTLAGIFIKYSYDTGSLSVYEDALVGGTAADYGINPINATSPSTFTDGTLLLRGDFSTFSLTVNMSTGAASFSGNLEWSEGVNLPSLWLPSGWTFAGLGSGVPGIPEGYLWQVDGEAYKDPSTATEPGSWGDVKSLFR
jgi:hypothetical protein